MNRFDPPASPIFQTLDRCERFPYRSREYVRRFAWLIVQATLFRFSPSRFNGWRRFLLRRFGARLGRAVGVHGSTRIMHPWLLRMGDFSNLGPEVIVYNLGPVDIGSHTAISQQCYLCAGSHDYRQRHLPLTRPPITIGNGVWLCAGVFVNPAVTIGDNVLAAAKSVVTRDVPAGTIVGGNPAKVLRDRPMDEIRVADAPLKILHLLRNADTGGLVKYVVDLCTAMHEAGHRVTVAADAGPAQAMLEAAPFPFIRIPLAGSPSDLLRCTEPLRNVQYDLIHTHYRRATFLGRRLQAQRPVPLLYTLHLSHTPLGWWRRPLSDFGDHTHVAAEEARDWLIRDAHLPADRISLIHHGIQSDKFPRRDEAIRLAARGALGLDAGAMVAAYVGRFDDPKNEDWLLDLAITMPQLHLVMAGGGPHEQRLRERIQRERFGDRVKLLGYRDPLLVYQAADALLLPSLREGFALVCGEAMSVGVPVLRTRTSGTAAMIEEGVTGRSTPIDHDAFLDAARPFLSDRAALRQMGDAAARRVRSDLRFETQLKDTIALYRRLIAGGSAEVTLAESLDYTSTP